MRRAARASFVVVKHATSPEAKRHKSEYDTKYESTPERRKYHVDLRRERRKRGVDAKGGPDMSHTKEGTLVAEDPHANRARHFKERGTLKSVQSAMYDLLYGDLHKGKTFSDASSLFGTTGLMGRQREAAKQRHARKRWAEEDEPPPMTEAEEAQHALVVGSKHGRKGQQYGDDVSNRGRRGRGGRGKGSQLGDSSRSSPHRGLGDAPPNLQELRRWVAVNDPHSINRYATGDTTEVGEAEQRQKAGPMWNMAHRLLDFIEDKFHSHQQEIDELQAHQMTDEEWQLRGIHFATQDDDKDEMGRWDLRNLLSEDLQRKLYSPTLQGGRYNKRRGYARQGGRMDYTTHGEVEPHDMLEIINLLQHGPTLHNQLEDELFKRYGLSHGYVPKKKDLHGWLHDLVHEHPGGQEMFTDLFKTGLHGEIEQEMQQANIMDLDETPSGSHALVVARAQHALARQRDKGTTALDKVRYGGRNPLKPRTAMERMTSSRDIDFHSPIHGDMTRVVKPSTIFHTDTHLGPMPTTTRQIDAQWANKPKRGKVGVTSAQPTAIDPLTDTTYEDPNVLDVPIDITPPKRLTEGE